MKPRYSFQQGEITTLKPETFMPKREVEFIKTCQWELGNNFIIQMIYYKLDVY